MGPTTPLDDAARSATSASRGLVGLIVALAILCLLMLVAAFAVSPPGPAIAVGPPVLAEGARVALGIGVWVALSLATEAGRVRAPSGVMTSVGDGPLVAAMVLGGPAAAGIVALVGSLEARELRSAPWYGILANHAYIAVAAIVGGSVAVAVSSLLPGVEGLMVAGLAGGTAYMVMDTVLATGFFVLRGGAPRASFRPAVLREIGAARMAVVALGVLIAMAWTVTPLTLVLFVVPLYGLRAALAEAQTVAEAAIMRRELRRDRLTELPNALGLDERVADLRRAAIDGVCVLYLDLDGFKRINDLYDHDVGDDVLRVTAGRLRAACRDGDFVARLHGDEFVILSPGVRDAAEADGLTRRLVAAVEVPIPHQAGELHVSATVGARMVADLDGMDEAIREADLEMSRAKEAKASALGLARSTR